MLQDRGPQTQALGTTSSNCMGKSVLGPCSKSHAVSVQILWLQPLRSTSSLHVSLPFLAWVTRCWKRPRTARR